MDCDAERIWKTVENHRHNVPKKKRSPGAVLSLSDRLYDCYVECTQRQNDKNHDKRFRNTNNLLQQLSPDHTHLSLVVNLYSDERGYSLILNPDQQSEEIFLPYEDNEIFSYLDNQEIPPVLMEVLSHTSHCHMYGGCIVCEVRNYRTTLHLSSSLPYDSHLLLLRPTTESILHMVNEIANETGCSMDEQLLLESKLLLATQPPICLEPSTEVVWVTNRLHYNRGKFHTPSMRRYLRRRSQARRARMHYTSLQRAPTELRLHDFLTSNNATLRCPRPQFSDVWKKKQVSHASLSSTSAAAIARRVQELASIPELPPPTPSYLTSPSIDHTPSLFSPTHVSIQSRSQGHITAEEFLDMGKRQSTTPISTVPSQVGVVSPTITSPHHHRTHTSPVYKTTPTTISQPPQKVPPHTQKKSLPRTQSFTISLPRKYTSRGKPTLPTPTPALPTTPPTVPPTTPSTAPPTALRMISGKKFRPIAPAPLHPVVANTPQHPTAAVRSSIRVITTGNPRSSIQFGIRSLPKLKRAPNLPPLSASIQHVQISMPKLHRLAAPSLPHSKTYSPATRITMPVLHRIATENGTASISKATTPPIMNKLKKL